MSLGARGFAGAGAEQKPRFLLGTSTSWHLSPMVDIEHFLFLCA
jgi:hypothetical protein